MAIRRSPSSPVARRPAQQERGASLVEYALLVALIAVVCLAAVTAMGDANSGSVRNSASEVRSAMG